MDFVAKYFQAERAESFVFLGVGLTALALAAWFLLFRQEALLRGAAFPLALVALIEIAVGWTIMTRSPQDIVRVNQMLREAPGRIQTEEIPRMEGVMRNFVILRWVEIALLAAGLLMVILLKDQPFWRGAGMGLAIQALAMLAADYFAEARGHVYLDALRNL